MTADFSIAMMKYRRQWDNNFNVKKTEFCLGEHFSRIKE